MESSSILRGDALVGLSQLRDEIGLMKIQFEMLREERERGEVEPRVVGTGERGVVVKQHSRQLGEVRIKVLAGARGLVRPMGAFKGRLEDGGELEGSVELSAAGETSLEGLRCPRGTGEH